MRRDRTRRRIIKKKKKQHEEEEEKRKNRIRSLQQDSSFQGNLGELEEEEVHKEGRQTVLQSLPLDWTRPDRPPSRQKELHIDPGLLSFQQDMKTKLKI